MSFSPESTDFDEGVLIGAHLPQTDPESGAAIDAEPEEDRWVSIHAVRRIRQRLGIPKKAAQREAERALDGGRIEDFNGRFRRHLDWLRHRHGNGANYRITKNAIFAFQYGVLATVFPLPKQHRKSAIQQLKRLDAVRQETGMMTANA